MALKYVLWFATILVFLQIVCWSEGNPNQVPDGNSLIQNTTTAIKDVFSWIADRVDNLVDNIKGNDVYQNVPTALENLAQSIKGKGDEIVKKIKNKVD